MEKTEISEELKRKEEAREQEQNRINAMTKRQYRQYKSQWRKDHQVKVGLLNLPMSRQFRIVKKDGTGIDVKDVKPGNELYPYLYYPTGKLRPASEIKKKIKELEEKLENEKAVKEIPSNE